MEKIEKNKKIKIERFSVLSLIGNIIFYGVLIFAMIMVVILHFNQGKNQMIPIFGYSIAVIQTGSMIDGGFNIGDKVLVKVPNTDNLRVGDIIVFYKYLDPADNTITKINITEDIENYEEPTEYNQEAKNALDESRLTQQEVMEKDAILIFHRITTIYADEFGTRFFQTKGDSNYGADNILVREDFVVGQHVETAGIITGFFNFLSSIWGMLTVILVPAFILIIMQFHTLSKELKANNLVQKLLSRKVKYDNEELEKAKVYNNLDEEEKLFVYYMAPEEERVQVVKLLWGDLRDEALSKNQKVYAEKLKYSFDVLKQDEKAFWGYWLKNAKDKRLKNNINIMAITASLIQTENLSFQNAKTKAKEIVKSKRV